MFDLKKLTPAFAAFSVGVVAFAPAAVAAPPSPQTLTPPPPAFYHCTALGGGTRCIGDVHEVKVSEPQPELVCGTGADTFVVHDNGFVDQSWTRTYNADGDLTRRVVHERWGDTFWSNPLTGKTVPYTQRDVITDVLAVPGDLDTATETTVGENVMTDPITHQKVLLSTGRSVFGADGSLEFRAGQQPFLEAFVDGDMSVFDDVCAALS